MLGAPEAHLEKHIDPQIQSGTITLYVVINNMLDPELEVMDATAGMVFNATLSALAARAADNQLLRAAGIHLKERCKLVLMVRGSPPHLGHLRAMAAVTEIAAIVALPIPTFYARLTRLSITLLAG